jgi:hypothetical protein
MKIEAIFGGVLALFVLAVAAYAIITGSGRGNGPGSGVDTGSPSRPGSEASLGPERYCPCFDEGFKLARSNVSVMSTQYRTGFEYCRATHGDRGSCAFTAGWNSGLSARPFEATCLRALRRECP